MTRVTLLPALVTVLAPLRVCKVYQDEDALTCPPTKPNGELDFRCEIQSCLGCKLSALPKVRSFIKDEGHADFYPGLRVTDVPKKSPELVCFRAADVVERTDLSKMETQQIHDLVLARGYARCTPASLVEDVEKGRVVTEHDWATYLRARADRKKAWEQSQAESLGARMPPSGLAVGTSGTWLAARKAGQLSDTLGVHYRNSMDTSDRASRGQMAKWGSEVRGVLAVEGWVEVIGGSREQFLPVFAKAAARTLYLPEYVYEKRGSEMLGKRIVHPIGAPGQYFVDKSSLKTGSPTVAYRNTPRHDDRSDQVCKYGSVVNGELGEGWLKVEVVGEDRILHLVNATARTLYLPEYIKGKRVVVLTEAPGQYLVDNSDLQSPSPAAAYRNTRQQDDRSDQVCKYGSVVTGELSEGWLQVEVSTEL